MTTMTVAEARVTLGARGQRMTDDEIQHLVESLEVLAQAFIAQPRPHKRGA